MKKLLLAIGAILALCLPAAAFAASCTDTGYPPGTVVYDPGSGLCYQLKVNSDGSINTSGGGGGGGAVTAVSGAYALGSIVDLGTGATPGANTTNGILKTINTTLGSPLQSGGSVVATDLDVGTPTFTSGSALNAVLFSADTSGYGGTTFQLSGTFSATVQAQVSDDNTNWVQSSIYTTTGSSTSSISSVGVYYIPGGHRYVRAQITVYTSGTVAGVAYLRKTSVPFPIGNVTLQVSTASIGGLAAINSSGGLTSLRWTTGASGVIKASAGRLYTWTCDNTNVAVRYLQLYNKATAGVPGTDTPVFTIPMSATSFTTDRNDIGYYNNTGMSWAVTTDYAGATAGTSGDIICSVGYN